MSARCCRSCTPTRWWADVDITLIHERIAEAFDDAALQGNTLQLTVTPYMPLYPTPPHFYPFNWRINYDRTYGTSIEAGMAELTTTWHLCLSLASDESGHQEATRLAGSGETTIRSVLIGARGAPGEDALGGACDDLRLTGASGPNLINISDTVNLLVIEFPIFVIGH